MEPTRKESYQRRIAKLQAQMAQRDKRIAALEKQVAELVWQNQILIEQNAELTQQVAKLEEQIARLSKNSSNSSKPPSSDIVKPPKEKRSKGPRRQGGQPGHRGVNRQPFTTEQIDETVEVPAGRCCCGHKGRGQPMDEPRIQQVAELHDKPILVTEYRLHGYVCSKCGRVVWAELPAGVIEGQLFGPRLQALIAYMKGSLHASYSGLEAFCREVLRIEVARSHLCNTIARVNEALAAPYEELQEHIPTEPVLNTVPPTNNASEQTLRQSIIDRKITQGSRSLMGRQWNARIWTVLATCRKQGRSAWQFLQEALSAYCLETPAPSLLPQVCKA